MKQREEEKVGKESEGTRKHFHEESMRCVYSLGKFHCMKENRRKSTQNQEFELHALTEELLNIFLVKRGIWLRQSQVPSHLEEQKSL